MKWIPVEVEGVESISAAAAAAVSTAAANVKIEGKEEGEAPEATNGKPNPNPNPNEDDTLVLRIPEMGSVHSHSVNLKRGSARLLPQHAKTSMHTQPGQLGCPATVCTVCMHTYMLLSYIYVYIYVPHSPLFSFLFFSFLFFSSLTLVR